MHYGQVFHTAPIKGENVEFEMGYLLFDKVQQDVMTRFNRNYTNYPTNFYRTPEEEKEYLPQNLPKLMMHRKEYAFIMFHLFILGDTIWASSDMSEYDFNQLYRMEKTIDILDTYFVRAYGNYKFFIITLENSAVSYKVKYMPTF